VSIIDLPEGYLFQTSPEMQFTLIPEIKAEVEMVVVDETTVRIEITPGESATLDNKLLIEITN
jgi:hypothetical protein